MRLYSVGEMPVNGPKRNGKRPLMIAEGIYYWEIARQTKEGFWVRKHGQPKALRFVPRADVGKYYFTEPKEVLTFMRARLRQAIKNARKNITILEREYADVKRGMVYTREWSPKSIRPLPDGPVKLAMSGAPAAPRAHGEKEGGVDHG